ncbi:anti-sigma factor [Pelomonas sp. KK5]|uniref:anti-sigma factor family protein n=1 Tax=Pelomonas sp. KK5 TaxID=1855730 RepID=UPI00097C1B15|nr:anti-sigma factor [Pelomonas sp. KK5]
MTRNDNRQPPAFSDSELHARVDGQLDPQRARELDDWLIGHPEDAQRLDEYRAQKRQLRALFDPVIDEPLPERLRRAARRPWAPARFAAAAAVLLSVAAGGGWAGWALHGRQQQAAPLLAIDDGLARRAAIAHAVYTPELRRPVEVDAAHEDQLVTWLSRRLGAPMKPPHLQAHGYALEGGRLLPGAEGPVAQFMYRDEAGGRLTLYVTREAGAQPAASQPTAFRFVREGKVNVFYWVDGAFGYALSGEVDRAELARVSSEVYKQIGS